MPRGIIRNFILPLGGALLKSSIHRGTKFMGVMTFYQTPYTWWWYNYKYNYYDNYGNISEEDTYSNSGFGQSPNFGYFDVPFRSRRITRTYTIIPIVRVGHVYPQYNMFRVQQEVIND
jgi:hypothetical protein